MPLPAHVREYACSLYLAAELAQSLLEVLSFGDLNLQNSLTPSGTRLVRDTTPRTSVSVSATQNSELSGELPTRGCRVDRGLRDAGLPVGIGQRRNVKREARRFRICSLSV